MNEAACITDLNHYELDRRNWLVEHSGTIDGFTTKHGAILEAEVSDCAALKAHTLLPAFIDALAMTSDNRHLIGASFEQDSSSTRLITPHDIDTALSFVQRLLLVDLSDVAVLRVDKYVMPYNALGAVYSCGVSSHVVVVPEQSFDPMGVLVRQFAIAAHYTAMRGKPGLAAMMSDNLTQSMVGHFAMLTFATHNPDKCALMRHLQLMVSWEFAKGLSKTPQMPMGFVASDLGGQLMKDYGGEMFKAVMTHLYESMTHGQAIWFGSNNFSGMVLALLLLGDDHGVSQFIKIDSGDRTLGDKLNEAFPGFTGSTFDQCSASMNAKLTALITSTSVQAA